MSQDERTPAELSDSERVLLSLVPKASRIDRDRLMIRLGEQAATRSSTPWKWATAASLLLALGLGVRPTLIPDDSAPTPLATHAPPDAQQSSERNAVAPPAVVRPLDSNDDWLLALAADRFDSSRTLSVRPPLGPAALASRGSGAQALDNAQQLDAPGAVPPIRTPTLRWGDRPLRRDVIDLAAPPTS
jgi:hypothetical protein